MKAPASALSLPSLFSYGLFGLPLAMLALPIYIYVAPFYAQRSGLDLAQIGVVLLAARIAAAFIDPALGAWMAHGGRGYAACIGASLPLLLLGFGALFHPPAMPEAATLAWFLAALLLVYSAYGLAGIAHQSWGAALTQARAQRARVTAVREGCGLLGVILAAGLTSMLGYDGLSLAFAACLLAAGALLLARAPRPVLRSVNTVLPRGGWRVPFRQRPFRWLFAVLLVNGVAAAIPATLFLFFATDYLRLGHYAGPFLIVYFCAAAASMPVWVALARRWGEARAWGGAMLLAARVCLGLWPGRGRRLGLCGHLPAVGAGAGRRPGLAARAAGGPDRRGRPGGQTGGGLFRLVELGCTDEPGAGGRHRAALAGLARLCARQHERLARPVGDLRLAALRPEAAGGAAAVACALATYR